MFDYSYILFGVILIPFLILLFFIEIFLYRKRCSKISGLNKDIIIPYYTEGQKWLRNIFYITGFIFLILSAARPRWGLDEINSEIIGRDVIILVDVSYSMTVPDVYPSRLELLKKSLINMLSSGITDRIGVMVFSDETEMIVPLTHDYTAVSHFIQGIYPGMTGRGGTDIGKALLAAFDFFGDDISTDKMILLLSDGEDLSDTFKVNINRFREAGIKIFSVGIGTQNGQPVPVVDEKGEIKSYVRDRSGSPVVSRLDEKFLTGISELTGGKYYRISSFSDNLSEFYGSIKGVDVSSKETQKVSYIKDRFNIFLIPALILLSIGFVLDLGKVYNRGRKFELSNLFSRINLFLLIFLLPFFNIHSSESNLSNRLYKNGALKGNSYYNKGDFSKALQEYGKSANSFEGDKRAKLYFNIANSFMELGEDENALKYYELAIKSTEDKLILSHSYYNRGIVNFRTGKFEHASDDFKTSLILEDSDDARHNYVVSRLFSENKESEEENESDDESNEDDKEDKSEGDDKQQISDEMLSQLLEALEEKERQEIKEKTEEDQNKNNQRRGNYW